MNSVSKELLFSYKSTPIMIPKILYTNKNNNTNAGKNMNAEIQKYDLNYSNIMPDNASPPNSWKSRLDIRMNTY